jgi:two-component system nitrogen regulation sensor histidine kinase NtrY
MDPNAERSRRTLTIFLMIVVPALLVLGWIQASFNLSFIRPSSPWQTIVLLAVSTVIFLAFVIFALILLRILLKLYVERRQGLLGSRFKTKMVIAFLGLSLVPVCFLFAFAYGLLNRSIDKWFGIPFDIIHRDANHIVQQLESDTEKRALDAARNLGQSEEITEALMQKPDGTTLERLLQRQATDLGLESALCLDAKGHLLARAGNPEIAIPSAEVTSGTPSAGQSAAYPLPGNSGLYSAACSVESKDGKRLATMLAVVRLPASVRQAADEIQLESRKWDQLSQERKAVKRNYLSMLWLLTLVILFVAAWLSLFLSKQVTVPIQALVHATHEVSKGNLGYQVSARASDELGSLIESFNQMTRQIQENRLALERAASDLQTANRELEERGNKMEAILENIPTGVISFDTQGRITQLNSTAERMFHREETKSARALSGIFSPGEAHEIGRLLRRAARQGVVSWQTELDLGGRRASVALTISSIRTRHGTVGSVMVLEDLTELLRAQKAAAWQEVAQRIAHEIKNPLTPIQLSTERIRRLIERAAAKSVSPDLVAAAAESTSLITREIETLKTLVDEFSNFARFPASKPVPANLNSIIENALNVFEGRLTGITVHRDLAPDLPLVQADPEQMRRAVVNLIDNAAEALDRAVPKEIWVRTELDTNRDVVELVVADSGPGISPETKEKLFLPYFSTKRRGTGLGLAIVSRFVSEHNGAIHIEENRPSGAKFVIELPLERTAVLES